MIKSKGIALAICLGLVTNCGIEDQTSRKADTEVAYYDDGGAWGGYGLDDREDEVLQAVGAVMLITAAAVFLGPKVTKVDASGLKFWKKIDYQKAVKEAEGWYNIKVIDENALNNIKLRAIISHPSKAPLEPTYTPKAFRQALQKFKTPDNTETLQSLLMNNSVVADFVINQGASLSYLANNIDDVDTFKRAYAATNLSFANADEAYTYFKGANFHLHWVDPSDATATLEKFRNDLPSRMTSMDAYFVNVEELFSGIPKDTNLFKRIKNRFKAHSATSIANTRFKLEQEMADALKNHLGDATNNAEIKKAMGDLKLRKWFDDQWTVLQKQAKKENPNMKQVEEAKVAFKNKFYSQETTDLAGKSDEKRAQWNLLEKFFKMDTIK